MKHATSASTPTEFRIAILGHPNAGKTTTLNRLADVSEAVGNWEGVTVSVRAASRQTESFKFVFEDLPGIHTLALAARGLGLHEQLVLRYLRETPPDLVLYVLNSLDWERGLYLLLQLLELGLPCWILLTNQDRAIQASCWCPRPDQLSQYLDIPVYSAAPSHSLWSIFSKAFMSWWGTLNQSISGQLQVIYPAELESEIQALSLEAEQRYGLHFAKGIWIHGLASEVFAYAYPSAVLALLERYKSDPNKRANLAFSIASARYHWIDQVRSKLVPSKLSEQTTGQPGAQTRKDWALHPWLGLPVFVGILYLLFWATLDIGGLFTPVLEGLATIFFESTGYLMYELGGISESIVSWWIDGIGGGICAVLPLIPQLCILFFCLALLEESGYMSRAAVLMDRLMRTIGLPGQAFVPLLLGFGCNVPAIMSTRILHSFSARIAVCIMIPFISCSARLAIFALFGSIFFQEQTALIVFSLYIVSLAAAIFTGFLCKNLLSSELGPHAAYLTTLAHYQWPRWKVIWQLMRRRLYHFVTKTSGLVVCSAILFNALNVFGWKDGQFVRSDRLQESLLASIGRKITPYFAPIGLKEDHWQATVGILAGVAAKELVIGTVQSLYSERDITSALEEWKGSASWFYFQPKLKAILSNFKARLKSALNHLGVGIIIPGLSADTSGNELEDNGMKAAFGSKTAVYSYLLFILLYVPCLATLSVLYQEIGIRWMLAGLAWSIDFAYCASALFYQMTRLIQGVYGALLPIAIILIGHMILWRLCLFKLEQHNRSAGVSTSI